MAGGVVDPEEIRGDLEKIVGTRRVSIDPNDLTTYARDMWPRLLISLREGKRLEHRPHAVAWPESAREVAAIVRLARARGLAVVPYGGGSGVCGGTVPLCGGITVDLKRMDDLLGVDGGEMICDVEAGMNGERFERALSERGFTLGHFPSSIYCSTVGGWLATRAAGQLSTKYGKIEDRVAGLTVVTGVGDIVQTDAPTRASRGPNWTQLFTGSEGTLGIVTSARLRLSPAPALRTYRGFSVESVAHGVDAIRRVMQKGLRPAIVRLYDEIDTFLHAAGGRSSQRQRSLSMAPSPPPSAGALPPIRPEPGHETESSSNLLTRAIGLLLAKGAGPGLPASGIRRSLRQEVLAAALSHPRLVNNLGGSLLERFSRRGCLLIMGWEGARIRTEVEVRLTMGELARSGAVDLGEEPGRDWLEHRYSVSYRMSPLFRDGAFVDTLEVASTWERLLDLYEAVKDAISRHALVMAHFSHAYPEGCSIYFTFVGFGTDRRAAEKVYDAIWRDGLGAATRVGATISHHHGVGLLKAPYMHGEHRDAMALLRALKGALDPDGIMNPGKLGLPPRERATP